MSLHLHWSTGKGQILQLNKARIAKHTSGHFSVSVSVIFGRSFICFSKHAVKREISQMASSVASVSCKQHSGQLNQKFQFEIFFSFLVYKCWREQWSETKWKTTISLLNIPHARHTPPPTRKTCHNDFVVSRGEVKGHRHREHILILSGKLGRVQAQVPDSKIKTFFLKHIEVQVKNKELLQWDRQMHTERESSLHFF